MTGAAPRAKKKIDKLRSDFPAIDVEHDVLYRSHRATNGAVYYCTCGTCRFDAPPIRRSLYGTCCTARDPVIAVLEHLAGQLMVTDDWIAQQAISHITPRRKHRIADLQDGRIYGTWGIDGDLQVGDNRRRTQGWGAAFQQAGFDGVLHASRRDTSLDNVCIAFYGAPGANEVSLTQGHAEDISSDVVRSLEHMFGVQVFPKAPLLP